MNSALFMNRTAGRTVSHGTARAACLWQMTMNGFEVLEEGFDLPTDRACLVELCARMHTIGHDTLSCGMSVAEGLYV